MRSDIDKEAIFALSREHGVFAELTERARVVLRAAQRHAPSRTGTYRASLRIGRIRSAAQPYVTVYSVDRKAMWLEYGTGQPGPTPHFGVLTRALRAGKFDHIRYDAHWTKGPRG
jgi:hypothetical protein